MNPAAREAIIHRFDLTNSSIMKVTLLIAASLLAFIVSGVGDHTDRLESVTRTLFYNHFPIYRQLHMPKLCQSQSRSHGPLLSQNRNQRPWPIQNQNL